MPTGLNGNHKYTINISGFSSSDTQEMKVFLIVFNQLSGKSESKIPMTYDSLSAKFKTSANSLGCSVQVIAQTKQMGNNDYYVSELFDANSNSIITLTGPKYFSA